MKGTLLLIAFLFALKGVAQKPTPLPHGLIFGAKPDTSIILSTDTLKAFMGKRMRISTTLKAKVMQVTQTKGGWFTADAGNGQTIKAHFTKYGVTIPLDLKGRVVLMEGLLFKQVAKVRPKHGVTPTQLIFEVKGLMVYQ